MFAQRRRIVAQRQQASRFLSEHLADRAVRFIGAASVGGWAVAPGLGLGIEVIEIFEAWGSKKHVAAVSDARSDDLKNARPATTCREYSCARRLRFAPIGHAAVVSRATYFIRKAGISVPRAGSHVTAQLRAASTEPHFSLKHIGDYIGHRSASSTQIYRKIAIEQLREFALGDGEDVL
jgi:hypothetical protein